jgi:hypothetical protein
MPRPKKFTPEAYGLLTGEVTKGVGSDTLLRTLGPHYDAQFESLLTALEKAPANLETLLDLRAQIKAYRVLKRELSQAIRVGHEAGQRLAESD